MCKEVGEETAIAWKDVLNWEADKITGSTSEALRQFLVPVIWFEKAKTDRESLSLRGDKAADKADMANFESISAVELPVCGKRSKPEESGGGSSTDRVVVKTEPPPPPMTPCEAVAEEVKKFKTQATTTNSTIQMRLNDLGTWKAETVKSVLHKSVGEAISKLTIYEGPEDRHAADHRRSDCH